MAPSCYVAGPEGFNETSRGWLNEKLIPMLEAAGLTVISPWKLTGPEEVMVVKQLPLGEERLRAHQELNARIGQRNYAAMQMADCMVASLEGPDVDSGTAAEIGAFALMHEPKHPIIAYRTDWRETGEEGAIVNLQLEYFITLTGGKIVTSFEELQQAVQVPWR